jgi:hypothetical protein
MQVRDESVVTCVAGATRSLHSRFDDDHGLSGASFSNGRLAGSDCADVVDHVHASTMRPNTV